MKQETQKIIEALSQAFLKAFKACLYSDYGINPKVGRNTLRGSNMDNESISRYIDKDGDVVVELLVNDYIQYIESGRRKGAKFPPVNPIIRWCRKHNIPTDNSTVFLIRRAISRDGIRPRPIMKSVFEDMDSQMKEIYLDRIFNSILTDLNQFFNQ